MLVNPCATRRWCKFTTRLCPSVSTSKQGKGDAPVEHDENHGRRSVWSLAVLRRGELIQPRPRHVQAKIHLHHTRLVLQGARVRVGAKRSRGRYARRTIRLGLDPTAEPGDPTEPSKGADADARLEIPTDDAEVDRPPERVVGGGAGARGVEVLVTREQES